MPRIKSIKCKESIILSVNLVIPAILELKKINFLSGRDSTGTLSSCNGSYVSNFSQFHMHIGDTAETI